MLKTFEFKRQFKHSRFAKISVVFSQKKNPVSFGQFFFQNFCNPSLSGQMQAKMTIFLLEKMLGNRNCYCSFVFFSFGILNALLDNCRFSEDFLVQGST